MPNDNVTRLIQPGFFDDQLTEILRNGARALLAKAVEVEVADFLGQHAGLKTEDGHQRVVRHGHLPEREVMTGIGPVTVRQPRVRDREANAADPDRIRFSPSILPPYMRRSKSIETGRWHPSPGAPRRRKAVHPGADRRDAGRPQGTGRLHRWRPRESPHDWRGLLLDLKRRGLDASPQLVIADGALGFWKAAGEVWPKTREQRCWVHKTATVLAKAGVVSTVTTSCQSSF